jgi:hypothetical protein
MERNKYISPRIKVVAFTIEEGFLGSVRHSTQADEVFINFLEDNTHQGYFRNEQFDNPGDNDYNFFGD